MFSLFINVTNAKTTNVESVLSPKIHDGCVKSKVTESASLS